MNKVSTTTLSLFFWFSTVFGATYKIDPSHSNVTFTIRHIVSKVSGSFREYSGEIEFDEKKPDALKATFSIQVNSIDSANQKRDEHLRNADFFNVEKFPLITFTSKKVKATGKQKFRVSGDLMMHGVTKDIPVDLEFIGVEKDPWGNRRAGFLVTGKVNRKDFGIVWNKTLESGNLLLGESVDINVQIEAIEQTPKAAEKAS